MLLVETVGAFQLVDNDRRNPVIRHQGYTVVHRTDFVSHRISLSQVHIIAELSEKATDEEWLKYYEASDFDLDLAKESFLSSFGKDVSAPPDPPAPPSPPPSKGKPITKPSE